MNAHQALEKILEDYKKRYVNPDILILEKALGNGYPITAIIGKEEVMKYAEKVS